MRGRLRVLLAAMMFLEYAVWGAWTPVLALTLGQRLNATGVEVGAVYGVLWLACIITPSNPWKKRNSKLWSEDSEAVVRRLPETLLSVIISIWDIFFSNGKSHQ